MISYFIYEEELDYENRKKYPDIEKPDKLSHRKLVSWEEVVYNYFTNMKNSQGSPLEYFTWKNPSLSGIVIDREQEIIQNSPLQGNTFPCENKKVLEILKELKVHTDDETWTKVKQCD